MDYKQIVLKDLLSNKEIDVFCKANKLTEKDILKNLVALSQYKQVKEACSKCDGKSGCHSEVENLTAKLVYQNGAVKLQYVDCELANKMDPNNLEVMYFTPIDQSVIKTSARDKVFGFMSQFLSNYKKGEHHQGLYIYGDVGVGKSFLAYNFAQKLTQKGIKVIYVYYPDLIRQIKSNMGSVEMEKIIKKVKQIEVLFIDDLGAENNTAYVRDDILSPILQYRMNNDLATFFTSNCSLEQLIEHFSDTNYESDHKKAIRIVDRIRYLAKPVEIKDKNYRNS